MFEVLYISMLVFGAENPWKNPINRRFTKWFTRLVVLTNAQTFFADSTCKGWWKSAHESMNAIHCQSWNCYRVFFNILQSKKTSWKARKGILLQQPWQRTQRLIHILKKSPWLVSYPVSGGVCFWKIRLRINFLRFQRGKSQVTKFCELTLTWQSHVPLNMFFN